MRSGHASTAREQWQVDRTTFQRVYDVLVRTYNSASAQQFAEWADCSENGARQALEQLSEMGIAERTNTRPATYQRNPSYFRWKRVEQLAREHSPIDLRARIDDLIEDDQPFQAEYGVPDPDAVVTPDDAVEDHETMHERWDDLTEWRTIRRDITVLKRAVQRAESTTDDRAQA
ncbi:DUF7342 family protein [Haladaptatus halobius]|uniref:DUF7342 family protein n=1 Tax=Haladaptatus halobius TaxID=2884875 RepID=UPI001D0A51A7|nr:hypothetical protein [Haladaptatus halobius]